MTGSCTCGRRTTETLTPISLARIAASSEAAQRVALGDAADIGQRIVQVARQLVTQHLSRDHVDQQWHITYEDPQGFTKISLQPFISQTNTRKSRAFGNDRRLQHRGRDAARLPVR